MNEEEIKSAISQAIEAIISEEPPLSFRKVHERATAHRLAVHMEKLFKGWNIDCEYDRDMSLKKELVGMQGCAGRKTDEIFPDIIVHRRERSGKEHNLLVIELKKDAKTDPCDDQKLKLFTAPDGHYQYQFGLYINIDKGKFTCTWYEDGEQQARETAAKHS